MKIEEKPVKLRPMDGKDLELYCKAINFLKVARPTLDKAEEAARFVLQARAYYGVPDWKMWIVSLMAVATFILSLVVAVKLPHLSIQYKVIGIGLSAGLSLPFMLRINLQRNALLVHYVGMFATVLGIVAGGYYLFALRPHTYANMFNLLLTARVLYSLIPVIRILKSGNDKSALGLKLAIIIALISQALRTTATLAAVLDGVFPVVSYAFLIFGIEVVHLVWREFGVKGTSVIGAKTSVYIASNASALMSMVVVLMFT